MPGLNYSWTGYSRGERRGLGLYLLTNPNPSHEPVGIASLWTGVVFVFAAMGVAAYYRSQEERLKRQLEAQRVKQVEAERDRLSEKLATLSRVQPGVCESCGTKNPTEAIPCMNCGKRLGG